MRTVVLRAAQRYGAHDPEDIAQLVLIDAWRKPWLCEPQNIGALIQLTRFRVLHALRAARRHEARGDGRFTSYEAISAALLQHVESGPFEAEPSTD